ncbi:MAG: NAD(P)/FAD-dependent oxidoreductase [Deltaproteobacteria bacterium]|nr:NAD(P)/FAD-dependent oxidoreductase [Deltaproteobacteria bacterium]MBN2688040.1 NAD(P)/FAD-dependent oxidoreductase [Deltaproteobacteria bacterium]
MTPYHVIVVGGGAAGLMAASQSAEAGARTLLLEKMDRPGRKLRITGKGRCNLTNVVPLPVFLEHFGVNGRFLRQAFSRFFSDDLIEFLHDMGVKTVTERGGRVFPESEKAQDVVDALIARAKHSGVTIVTGAPVERLIIEDGAVRGVAVTAVHPGRRVVPSSRTEPETYRSDRVIIATGGASYPATGSAGDGYRLAESAGHRIVPIRPALVPVETGGATASKLQGLSLRNVTATVMINGVKKSAATGEMLFTHFGLSGPIILSLSGDIVDALRSRNTVTVSIDLKPALDEAKLDDRLLRDLNQQGRKLFQTFLRGLLPRKLIPVCVELTTIDENKLCHQITAAERRILRTWVKDFRLPVTGHRPLTEAIITAGGVDTKEVDPRTMESKIIRGLYFSGEILDIVADTGGFNLQAAFSTGWVAGRQCGLSVRS